MTKERDFEEDAVDQLLRSRNEDLFSSSKRRGGRDVREPDTCDDR
jgi:hypothetical protein